MKDDTRFLKCAICRNVDMKRLIEMGWNDRMTVADLAHAFGETPSATVIRKHLNEHVGEGINARDIPIEAARSTKQRVEALQKKMLDDIEARIQFAEERAAVARSTGNPEAMPSDWFDLLDKKNQAAIASVLKMQDQTDRRDSKKAEIAIDVMRLMGGAPPPQHLISDGLDVPVIEGEAEEVTDEATGEADQP